jgi:hypothetical protein
VKKGHSGARLLYIGIIWSMPPKAEERKEVWYLDGIYLWRKECILICCDDK